MKILQDPKKKKRLKIPVREAQKSFLPGHTLKLQVWAQPRKDITQDRKYVGVKVRDASSRQEPDMSRPESEPSAYNSISSHSKYPSGSEKELLPPISKNSGKLTSIIEVSLGSEKESYQTLDSEGSGKEIYQQEDASIPSLGRISNSDKELPTDGSISEIRLRYDPNHPHRGFIDKRSFDTTSGEMYEISSNPESELGPNDGSKRKKVNFYNVDESVEEDNGSLKEQYPGRLRPIKDKYLEQMLANRNPEQESHGSAKEIFRGRELKKISEYSTPLYEETSEEEKTHISKTESLSSHCDQISSSEQEPTPKNSQLYLDPTIRSNTLKINTVLKKTPSSIAMLAKKFLNTSKDQPVRQSLPRLPQNPQNLHDYGVPASKFSLNKPSNLHKSLENPTDRPEVTSNNYFTSEKPKSSDFLGGINIKPSVDWYTTEFYKNFQNDGVTKYNQRGDERLFDEEEVNGIYGLLKSRYSHTRTNKKIEGFFTKAMDTLADLLGKFSLNNIYRAIQKIYTLSDVQNTMKLILRVQSLVKARYVLFEIFQDIHSYKVRFLALTYSNSAKDLTSYSETTSP